MRYAQETRKWKCKHISGEDNIADMRTKNAKVGVLEKHMAEMKPSRRDAGPSGSQRSGEKQISAAELSAVGTSTNRALCNRREQQRQRER